MLAFALRADGWYLRSDIIWARPNPMPESVRDRPTKSHSYVFLLSKQPRYFWDQEAVREQGSPESAPRRNRADHRTGKGYSEAHFGNPPVRTKLPKRDRESHEGFSNRWKERDLGREPTRNVRSVWEIPTQPLPYDHYAAFPEKLAERCIKAGSSERGVCAECGAPWMREVDVDYGKSPAHGAGSVARGRGESTDVRGMAGEQMPRLQRNVTTTGWAPTCDHDTPPVPATVLDPFMGSGTTALVARKLGRHSIGIELNEAYLRDICADRLKQLSILA